MTVVVVTGAGGFVAGHTISLLLSRGYVVRATTSRKDVAKKYGKTSGGLVDVSIDASDPSSSHNTGDINYLDHLFNIPGANERLQIFYGSLLDASSWNSVITDDVEYVIHLAAPYEDLKPENPEDSLFKPIVDGTEVRFFLLLRL